jgi:hypothetical protein
MEQKKAIITGEILVKQVKDDAALRAIVSVEEHEVIRRVVLALYWFGIYRP